MQSEKGPLLDEKKVYDSEDNDFVFIHTRHNNGQRTRPYWARALTKGIGVFVIAGLVTRCLGLSHGMSPLPVKFVVNMAATMVRFPVY
jgi:hypothetical protein